MSQVVKVVIEASQPRIHYSTVEPLVLQWFSEIPSSSGLSATTYGTAFTVVDNFPLLSHQEIKEQYIQHNKSVQQLCPSLGFVEPGGKIKLTQIF